MRALLVPVVAVLLLVACGGGDKGADPTPAPVTAVGTKEPTPVGGDTDGSAPGEAPPPVEPELDEELTEIARDSIDLTLEPTGVPASEWLIEPQDLAEPGSYSCEGFQFDFSWQISDPYPPGSATVDWFIVRDSGEIKVANGPSGNQAVGCDTLRVVNPGSEALTLAVKYALGTASQE